ncbi:twin-arginine translocation signal domain-containing protein, partial [Streptomyces synnematoformans]
MSMQRRTFLGMSAAGTAGVGLSLLGAGQAPAAPRSPHTAQAATFAV